MAQNFMSVLTNFDFIELVFQSKMNMVLLGLQVYANIYCSISPLHNKDCSTFHNVVIIIQQIIKHSIFIESANSQDKERMCKHSGEGR